APAGPRPPRGPAGGRPVGSRGRRAPADARRSSAARAPLRRWRLERSRSPLYDSPPMLLAGLLALVVLVWPSEAHAWGPVTHLVHGSQVLESLNILGPALQEILREHRLPYLYGCVAADIVQAKKYTRSLYTHCHCWPVGWQI